MDQIIVMLQVLSVAVVAWGAYLCLAKRDRRNGERRRFARGEAAGRRRADSPAAATAMPREPVKQAASRSAFSF